MDRVQDGIARARLTAQRGSSSACSTASCTSPHSVSAAVAKPWCARPSRKGTVFASRSQSVSLKLSVPRTPTTSQPLLAAAAAAAAAAVRGSSP
jgi:hypothetical protein